MELMRSHNNKTKDGHRVRVGVEEGGILEYFFGKDGKKGLKHERFVQFFRDLHEEVSYNSPRLSQSYYDCYNSFGLIPLLHVFDRCCAWSLLIMTTKQKEL